MKYFKMFFQWLSDMFFKKNKKILKEITATEDIAGIEIESRMHPAPQPIVISKGPSVLTQLAIKNLDYLIVRGLKVNLEERVLYTNGSMNLGKKAFRKIRYLQRKYYFNLRGKQSWKIQLRVAYL